MARCLPWPGWSPTGRHAASSRATVRRPGGACAPGWAGCPLKATCSCGTARGRSGARRAARKRWRRRPPPSSPERCARSPPRCCGRRLPTPGRSSAWWGWATRWTPTGSRNPWSAACAPIVRPPRRRASAPGCRRAARCRRSPHRSMHRSRRCCSPAPRRVLSSWPWPGGAGTFPGPDWPPWFSSPCWPTPRQAGRCRGRTHAIRPASPGWCC